MKHSCQTYIPCYNYSDIKKYMIYIASDHAGFQLKKALVTYIEKELKQPIKDLGPETYTKDDDYPDYAVKVSEMVANDSEGIGILICGSGHGMCIAANKIKGIRAILAASIESAELARKEDNANILCLSGRILSDEHARAITKTFLNTAFSGDERHIRRLNKITSLE